ncbi:MAG: DUF2066 domain-containing protein [Rhodospirillales bacterium]
MTNAFGKLVLILALLLPGLARAIELPGLYHGLAIVTGTLEPERSRGFRLALRDVLVKVSGEAKLLDDKTLQPILDNAKDYVIAFDYEDRKKGMKINDEQGTRDRPHDLRVLFDRAKIDALLAERGLQPWSAERPQLLTLIVVRFPANSYVLSADGQLGYAQRLALDAASTRRGVPSLLPTMTALNGAKLTQDRIAKLSSGELAKLPAALGGEMALRGVMVWDDKMPGWRTDWTLVGNGRDRRWHTDNASFDDAFRSGIGESAAILAGLR